MPLFLLLQLCLPGLGLSCAINLHKGLSKRESAEEGSLLTPSSDSHDNSGQGQGQLRLRGKHGVTEVGSGSSASLELEGGSNVDSGVGTDTLELDLSLPQFQQLSLDFLAQKPEQMQGLTTGNAGGESDSVDVVLKRDSCDLEEGVGGPLDVCIRYTDVA